jgi:mevalonate pyrophosphate decarboxylase
MSEETEQPAHQDLDITCFGIRPKQDTSPDNKSMDAVAERDPYFRAWLKRKRLKDPNYGRNN